jgi:uncharacterized protein YbjQ (UPF0145 family)
MPLFGLGGPRRDERAAQVDEQEKQQASIQALEAGGLPLRAQERIADVREHGAGLFSSNLSAQEALLLARTQYQPVGLVVGSSFYHVRDLNKSWVFNEEHRPLSQAYTSAQDLALRRMEEEATGLGAHGVIGVRFAITRRDWAEHAIEVTIMGTAVRGPHSAPDRPFTSDLSGQEFWQLHEAGYQPRGLVFGACVWLVETRESSQLQNQERYELRTAVNACRGRAMDRLKSMANDRQARYVVGVCFDRRVTPYKLPKSNATADREYHAVHTTIVGTSLVRVGGAQVRQAPRMILDLRDRDPQRHAQPAGATLSQQQGNEGG